MKKHDFLKVALFFAFVGLVLVLSACSGSDSLAGTYVCTKHWNGDDLVGELTIEFRNDGTYTVSPPGVEGTYEVSDEVVTLSGDLFPSGLDLQIEGTSLRIASDLGDTVYTKQ